MCKASLFICYWVNNMISNEKLIEVLHVIKDKEFKRYLDAYEKEEKLMSVQCVSKSVLADLILMMVESKEDETDFANDIIDSYNFI